MFENYANLGGDSSVRRYFIYEWGVHVWFASGWVYHYEIGENTPDPFGLLAALQAGIGANSIIKLHLNESWQSRYFDEPLP